MSLLKKMFGKNKTESSKTSLPEAIQKLRHTEELLLKKQNYLESKIQKELTTARNNATKNKKAALEALQRKKRHERQLQQIDGALTTLEAQRDVLETANANTVVMSTMKQATDALKSAHKFLSTEQVDEMMGDLVDQKELTEDISNAISQPVAFGDSIDDDELEEELAELELQDELKDVTPKLPSVPQEDIITQKEKPQKKKEEATKLKALA